MEDADSAVESRMERRGLEGFRGLPTLFGAGPMEVLKEEFNFPVNRQNNLYCCMFHLEDEVVFHFKISIHEFVHWPISVAHLKASVKPVQ